MNYNLKVELMNYQCCWSYILFEMCCNKCVSLIETHLFQFRVEEFIMNF